MVEAATRGENPREIARLKSGWLVAGEAQVMRGYCLLLPDPVVSDLNELIGEHRQQFLADMARAGDAILQVTQAARINYEILGNLDPALHAHIIPRYETESEALKTKPIWFYDWDAAPKFNRRIDSDWVDAVIQLLV